MTPDPRPTKLERANEMEVASLKAIHRSDLAFAKELRDKATELRQQDEQCPTDDK